MSEPMFKLKVVEAEKATLQADQTRFLDVKVQISRAADDALVEERRLGFPLDTSQEEIEQELAKFLAGYTSDAEQAAASVQAEADEKGADEVIAGLLGEDK